MSKTFYMCCLIITAIILIWLLLKTSIKKLLCSQLPSKRWVVDGNYHSYSTDLMKDRYPKIMFGVSWSFKNKVNMKWRQKKQFYDEDRELQNIGIKWCWAFSKRCWAFWKSSWRVGANALTHQTVCLGGLNNSPWRMNLYAKASLLASFLEELLLNKFRI